MSDWNAWLDDYFKRFSPAFETDVYVKLKEFRELAINIRANGKKMMFAGNGASASISSHGAVDFTKQAKVRSMDFNEPNLITAFSNDYGYENWMARALECYADEGDAVVLTSVSGTSPNVVKAAEYARDHGLKIVTFSGKSPDNPLRGIGDINFWIGSFAYNVVEAVHMLWLTTVVDMVVGQAEYSVD
ncbi:D-sedoheptulose-7-phosphate isomerase [Roseovarius indicus]|uniref:Phosphoheptose isomerase n=1 Tax=Roseovarius indicus TaxID=540747 RepID=A0A0T5P5V8_9RHOB|nr:SIS domain-containing protein [Roseovarius indicus]KRS16557.1 phosphoheptose isomerase [Roseovarius indicus]QEW28211.1 Phosphoheptose isomerase [Roseovarius indicus]SFE56460.1 Phosphoheptose isomerase [Roseovarius indicus]